MQMYNIFVMVSLCIGYNTLIIEQPKPQYSFDLWNCPEIQIYKYFKYIIPIVRNVYSVICTKIYVKKNCYTAGGSFKQNIINS